MEDWGEEPVTNGASAPAESDDAWGGGGDWGSSTTTTTKSGGGGGGGGGGRGCFNCGGEGHMSRECPEPKKERGGGGGNRACFNCNQEGHQSRDCPEPKKERNGGGGGGGGGRACFNCNQEGHQSRECPEPKKERTDRGPMTCRKCNEEGHMAKDCPQGGGNECRRCKKEGHMAKDCTEEVLGEDGKPKPPIYRPADITMEDEGLFDNINAGINFSKYDKIQVKVTGEDAPAPIKAFDDIIKSDTLRSGIEKSKFTVPTPVQKYALPILMNGRDLMACAQTGSGKTLAFLLPICQWLFSNSKELSDNYGSDCQLPVALIVTPTRELAIQIYTEAFKFCAGSIIKPQIIYGGTSSGHQLSKLSAGCHILVATPGRLLDFVDKGKIGFTKLRYLVLDEADRMIDQGFLPEIRKLMTKDGMPPKGSKQMLMFSATFPVEVQKLASEFLADNYLFLAVGVVGAANSDVEQRLVQVEKFQKRKLDEVLGGCEIKDRTIIFVEQKTTADFLASYLSQNNYKATSIHGDRYQSQREEALRDFRTGSMPVLVATSVASRGLDIKDVRHVINYDLPKEVDDYVHRIGRTGRVGNLGMATSFYDSAQDKSLAPSLVKILTDAGQEVPEWLAEEAAGGATMGGGFDGSGFGATDIRKNVPVAQAPVEDEWD